MTEEQARDIAEDLAEAMRMDSTGEWVIELSGGPYTADQLEAIAIVMRAESRT